MADWDLAKNSVSEIIGELAEKQDQIVGVVAIAFTRDGMTTWGMQGMVSLGGLHMAMGAIHKTTAELNALWGAPVMGSA